MISSLTIKVKLEYVTHPKSAQYAPGWRAMYLVLKFARTSLSNILTTSPISTTLPSAAPLKSLAITVKDVLPSLRTSLVWALIVLKTKNGFPSSSNAKPTTEPVGYPGNPSLFVEITPYPILCSIKVRTSSAMLSLAAPAWCSRKAATIFSSSALIGGWLLPPGAWWPVFVFFSSVLKSLACVTVLIILGAKAIARETQRNRTGLNFIFVKLRMELKDRIFERGVWKSCGTAPQYGNFFFFYCIRWRRTTKRWRIMNAIRPTRYRWRWRCVTLQINFYVLFLCKPSGCSLDSSHLVTPLRMYVQPMRLVNRKKLHFSW